jgi:hypothetical protein
MWIYWEITDTRKKNTETLIDVGKEVGIEINIKLGCLRIFPPEDGHTTETYSGYWIKIVNNYWNSVALDGNPEPDIGIHAEKTKHMLLSH